MNKFKKKLMSKINLQDIMFKEYTSLNNVFDDVYYGSGIKHKKQYDTIFKKGDVVTTNCGWDLGIVLEDYNGEFPKVCSRYSFYSDNTPTPSLFGGNLHWYKTGVNVDYKKWEETSLKYDGYEKQISLMYKKSI